MRIKAFHVEQFGILHNLTVEGLPPGLTIFLGNNEAGKSTCLDFFRVMLTGYADGRTKEGSQRNYSAGFIGQGGGSLLLETPQGLIRLLRRPGSGGGALTLSDATGNTLDVGLLDRLMGGVTRQVFRSVYGFSLTELQQFESLNSDEVRNALYGASFGLGLKSPGAALKKLENAMEALFKQGGSKQPLSEGLRTWEEVRRQIREAEAQAGRYDSLAGELLSVEKELASVRRDRSAQYQESRDLERRLNVWQLWEEWRTTGLRLERQGSVAETFPPDGLARLERAEDRREEAARQCRLLRERVDKTREELTALELDASLLSACDDLRGLSERRASCRNAVTEIPRISLELKRAEAELATHLSTLGPGWNVERIRNVDRSLFVREKMEHQAADMHVAETTYSTAMTAMDKAVRETADARHEVELAARTLEGLPMPVADLDEAARERLRKSLARTEDAQERMPERLKSQENAKVDFHRAVAQLHLRTGEAPMQVLDRLAEAQDTALQYAEDVRTSKQEADLARSLAEQAKEAEKQARLRMSRLQSERDDKGIPTRASIEARRDALRRLRKQTAELDLERHRAEEVKDALAAHLEAQPTPRHHVGLTVSGLILAVLGLTVLALYGRGTTFLDFGELFGAVENIPLLPLSNTLGGLLVAGGIALFTAGQTPDVRRHLLIAFGGLCTLMGGAAIVAKRFLGISSVELPSGGVLPLELWSGYLVLLAGVITLGVTLRRKGETSPQTLVTTQWSKRWEEARAKVGALENEVKALFGDLDVNSEDSGALDELETRLDAEREQRAANERMEQEMTSHSREIADLHRRTIELETDSMAKNGKVRTNQRRWHEYLMELGVQQEVPAPESAQTFFMRVENARRDWNGIKALGAELEEMEACGLELMRNARELLPAAMQPASWSSLGEIVNAVRRMLESCREADMAAEARARAEEALRSKQGQLQRAQSVQTEAVEALCQAEQRLNAAREIWRASLASMWLDLDLSPATTREALDCMGRCLDTEAEVLRLRGELERQCRERDAFVLPLKTILEWLKRSPRQDPDGQPDWMASHDAVLQEVEEHRKRGETRCRLDMVRAGQEEDLRAVEEADRDAMRQTEELLRLAEVEDVETFRRMDSRRVERDNLLRRREDLEDALRRAAGTTPLEDFLNDFSNLDKERLEQRLAELSSQLEATARQDERLADMAGNVRAELHTLVSSETLADLRVQEAALREDLRALGLEWSRHALARHLLLEARRRFEKERQPEVIRVASDLFASITDRSWAGINASLEDGQLRVLPPHGESLPPEQLSRGAQEQLYLALRLAHIRHHTSLTAPLPVIMDDVLVNFDPDRASRTAEALMGLARDTEHGPGHQILYFTCHPGTAEMLHKLAAGSALYRVDRGRIRAA